MSQNPPEALREMGAEFHHAAAKCDDALRALEDARQERIRFRQYCIERLDEAIAGAEETLRIAAKTRAAYVAELARLESQTGLDLLRAVVAERGEKPADPPAPADPFVPGLPPLRLREVWAEWEEKDSGLVDFRGDQYRGTMGDGTRDQRWRPMAELGRFADRNLWAFRPHGKTRAEVEKMAEEAEKQGEPEKPTLLDLRGLKVGTVCEFTAESTTPFTTELLSVGERMKVIQQETQDYGGSITTRVELSGGRLRWLDQMQPARVVEVPK